MRRANPKLLLTLAAVLLAAGAAAAADWQTEQIDPAIYGSASDAISPEQAAEQLLQLLNRVRARHGSGALVIDAEAAALAQLRAVEVAKARTASHYDEAGRKVEQRFNMLDRTDHATENLLLYEIGCEVFLTPQLLARMVEHWLAEPGHRANLLDPAHTGVGAGFVIEWDSAGSVTIVSAVNVFVNDYGDSSALPQTVVLGLGKRLSGNLDPSRASLAAIALGREDLADVVEPADPRHYSMPDPTVMYVAEHSTFEPGPGGPYVIHGLDYDPQTGQFSVDLYFPRHWSDCRIYVSVLAETADGQFPAMTQVVETHLPDGP
jgi:uncharacterized protein YkwD